MSSHGTSVRVSRSTSASALCSSGRALSSPVIRCTSSMLSPIAPCRASQCVSSATRISTAIMAGVPRVVHGWYATFRPPSARSVASTATVISHCAVRRASTQAIAGESLSCR